MVSSSVHRIGSKSTLQRSITGTFAVIACIATAACGGGPGAIGASCGADSQCESSFCYAAQCMDPEGDTDSDGLGNLQESELGTDPLASDSDGDGLADDVEIGADLDAPRDVDGDWERGNGLHDANESAIADADGDCIADQFDPDNHDVETDLAVLAALACRNEGACAADGAVVDASCDGQLECDYSGVPGWDGELEVSCDGLDNDCDGVVDEGLVWTDAKGVVLTVGAQCEGVSGCEARQGVVECGPEGQTLCSADPGGSDFVAEFAEIPCNGKDDDCDGITDNGAAMQLADGSALNVGDECTPSGLCANTPGVVECSPLEDGTAVCSTGPGGSNDQSSPETCDAADNDCDGEVDEDLGWTGPAGELIPLGEVCGLGACEGASVRCRAGKPVCCRLGEGGECDDIEVLAEPEACDSIDNDCDGDTDEAEDVAALCDGAGVCGELEPVSAECDDDGLLVCSWDGAEGYEAIEVSCNGVDDDCDGLVDEGITTSAGVELGGVCTGVGACAEPGEAICDPVVTPGTSAGAICSADLGGSEETCNGIDDDCDGDTDEGVDVSDLPEAAELVCADVGVCASFVEQPAICVDGGVACAAAGNAFYQGAEVSCDTQDNDCDGLTDEATPKLFTATLAEAAEGQPGHRSRWPAAASDDGAVWVFGGSVDDTGPNRDDLWRFDGDAGSWERFDAVGAPVARSGHAVTWDSNHGVLLVHGGSAEPPAQAAASAPLVGLFAWSPAVGTWQPVGQVGIVPDGGAEAELPARRSHTLTALGDGTLLLHGGVAADGLAATLLCTLEETGEGDLTCAWEEAAAQAADRSGHAAVVWDAVGALVLVGGEGAGAEAVFAESLDVASPVEWTALGDTKEQPAARTGHTVAADGERLVAIGGRTLETEGSESMATNDAWSLADVSSPGAAWEPLDVDAGIPALVGAFGWATEDGLHVAAGMGAVEATWRATATLPAGSGEWSDPEAWVGPAPRVGASLAVRSNTGKTWLLGGTRREGAYPLMDVWERSGDGPWQQLLAPVAASDGPFGQTRPATAGAAAAWDPVNQRLLIFGGGDAGTGEPSGVLWAFNPGTQQFFKPDAQGDPDDQPGPTLHAVLGVDGGGGEAWLLGSYSVDVADAPDHVLAVHRLDLATTTWTLAWTGAPGEPGAVDFLAGGVGAEGLRAVVQAQGSKSLQMWAWDAELGVLAPQGAATAPVFDQVLGGAYDRWSDRSAVVVDSNGLGGVHLLQLVHATGTVPGPLPAAVLSTDLDQSGWAVHPSKGLLGFGGRGVSGAGVAMSVTLAQKCVPP